METAPVVTLKDGFVWLDAHPVAYWALAGLASAGLVVRLVVVLCAKSRPPSAASSHRWVDPLVLLLFLFAWRWPFLLCAEEFNPDESQLIAGAITLTHDPVFWRAVDGTTSGPLNFYALLPIHWLGLPLDFFTVRFAALLMIWGALWAGLHLLRRHAGAAVAWLALLPAAALYATVTHGDLIHYSSEHFPTLLLAVAAALLAGPGVPRGWRLVVGAGLAGAAPWAKLQVGPMGAVLILWAAWRVWSQPDTSSRRGPALARLVTAALAPTLFVGLAATATGVAGMAWERYFENNLLYVGQAQPLAVALEGMRRLAVLDGRVPLFVCTIIPMCVGAGIWLAVRRIRPPAFVACTLLLAMAAAFAVTAPRREFLHYALLLPLPFTLLLGSLIAPCWQTLSAHWSRWTLAILLFASGLLPPLITRSQQPMPFMFGRFAHDWRYPASPEAEIIRHLTLPEGSLAVWGWACNLNVESGLPQATRDPHSIWLILPHPHQAAYRRLYLQDLIRAAPTVFVDATGPGAFCFSSRAEAGHEIFPELAGHVRQYYTEVADLGRSRVYVRNDRAGRIPVSDARLAAWQALGRPLATREPAALGFSRAAIPRELPRTQVNGREVSSIHAPCRVDWELPADARMLQVEFGFNPKAVAEGTSNGAEVFIELRDVEFTRLLHQQFLDPHHRPTDSAPVRLSIPLPPFTSSTRLVIRTEPGPYGDNAWDWVYLGYLAFRQTPSFTSEQFPGFNRPPHAAYAPKSNLVVDDGEPFFEAAPPVNLMFRLRGYEQRLHLTFGLRPGSYTGHGRSDGATFRAELRRPGQPAREIWRRLLEPLTREEDRGPQEATIPLGAVQRDDELILFVDAGPAANGAWDSTYLRRVIIE